MRFPGLRREVQDPEMEIAGNDLCKRARRSAYARIYGSGLVDPSQATPPRREMLVAILDDRCAASCGKSLENPDDVRGVPRVTIN